MIKIDKTLSKKIHSRQIEINSYDGGPDAIIVEGKLKDDRFQRAYRPNGESAPAGTIHHMIIRIIVKGPELTIEDIDVEMPTVPREDCRETLTSLIAVRGLRITSGFTARVKDLVGGAKGCAHLTALLVPMASAAVQGFWTAVARQPPSPSMYSESTLDMVIDTCKIWRSDGPLVKKFRERSKNHGRKT